MSLTNRYRWIFQNSEQPFLWGGSYPSAGDSHILRLADKAKIRGKEYIYEINERKIEGKIIRNISKKLK